MSEKKQQAHEGPEVRAHMLEFIERKKRNDTIEECARVAELYLNGKEGPLEFLAAAIRALKDKQ